MPARIRITRGVNAGTTHEIHVNFLRVGSDLSCDICIPSTEVPSLAVLVEYVEGTHSYQIHCRSKDTCYFNGRLMNPGDKRDWVPGVELAIGHALGFELELDTDPSPTPPEARRDRQQQFIDQQIQYSESIETESTEPSEKNGAGTSILPQLCVIVVCVAVSILAIISKTGVFDPLLGPQDDPIPTLKEVFSELDKVDEANLKKETYLRLFMDAQREEDRESTKERTIYVRLRNMIYQDRELNEDMKLCDKTVRYINDRIKNLSVSNE